MFAITIDQRRSRQRPDDVPQLLETLNVLPLVRRFERTAGDEVQGLSDDPQIAVDAAVAAAGRGDWWVGIGIGSVESPLPASVRESRGPALIRARAAVDRAHRSSSGLAVEGEGAVHAETALQALAGLVQARSPEGRQAVTAMRRSTSQKAGADLLGISPQAMSRRLQVARWVDEGRLRELAVHLLAEAGSQV